MNKQAAVVVDGIVTNVIVVDDEADPPFAIEGAEIVVNDEASIGDHFDGEHFTKP